MIDDSGQPLPLPMWDASARKVVAAGKLKEAISRWVSLDELWDLAKLFDSTPVDRDDVDAMLALIDDIGAHHWDFRQGRERQSLRRQLGSDVVARVRRVAARFGLLRRNSEPKGSYNDVLILGGTVRACYSRMALGESLLKSSITCQAVTALGGFRPLQPNEVDFACALLGTGVRTEVDALVAMAQLLYGPGDASIRQLGDHSEAVVVDTPIRVSVLGVHGNGRRARTDDTYRLWIREAPWNTTAPRRVLVVTSQIYVPYQHLEALRVLGIPRGWYVETVGSNPGEFLPSKLAPTLEPAHYLQEIRSTIHAMRRLMAELSKVN